MCAAGLIKKNKQEIEFIKNKGEENNLNDLGEGIEQNKKKEKEKNDEIDEKIRQKTAELEEKTKKLIKNYLTLKFYEKYTNLNDTFHHRKHQKKIDFPCDFIRYDKSYPIKIIPKDDLTRILILSNGRLSHLTSYEAIKRLLSAQMLSNLNDNIINESNLNQNKSNSKKSTNDESILDEIINLNDYDNIDEDKEKKVNEEDPKKIKIFNDPFNDFSCIISNESKNDLEKDDNLVFNYLKGLKVFKDELTINETFQSESNDIENNYNNNCNKDYTDNNNFEKENDNTFTENRFRKNSNMSYASNIYDENGMMKQNKGDCMSEIGLYN
jgi:hypothetical protein